MAARGAMPMVRVVLDAGPLGGVGLGIPWKWRVPPTVAWLSRDASERLVVLDCDEQLLNLVAARAAAGGLGWVPYRRARDEPLELQRGLVWRYGWDRAQDPAQQRAERDRLRGLRAVG